jgi:tRNA-dihydrouridine synthase
MTMPAHLILAPFKGLTNKVYRNAFARHFGGFDAMVAPFISDTGEIRVNPSKLHDIIPANNNLITTIPQFISTNAREIILLAKALQDHGFNQMNWNMGCPFSRIAEKFRGCGILPYPDMLQSLLDEVFASISIRLSIKTRLGYKRPDELVKILEIFNTFPIKDITIHARTGQQLYRGDVDHTSFAQYLSISNHPVIYNGDIYNINRYRLCRKKFPMLNTWMIGRGALMNPFLPLEIRGIQLPDEEKRDRLSAFHHELIENARRNIPHEKKCLGWMKATWYYLAGVFSNGSDLFSSIRRTNNFIDYHRITEHALTMPFANTTEQENYFRFFIKHV